MLINLPSSVSFVLKILHKNGYQAQIVGGCVRDALMGKVPFDWDICTSATPTEMLAVFQKENIKTIPTGIKHGTITACCFDETFEITTYRTENTYINHRKPNSVNFTKSLEDDLSRRDFTINAMAYDIEKGIIDPFNGRVDLKNKVLRCVGNADKRFEEDALRIMRGLRFISTLNLKANKKTSRAFFNIKHLLRCISQERIYSELCRLICGENASSVLNEYHKIFNVVFPDIEKTVGFNQNSPYHNKDVWGHITESVGYAQNDVVVKWALLFHDIAKPRCYSCDEKGIGHFYGHASLSAKISTSYLKALKADKATILTVKKLIKWHDTPLEISQKSVAKWLLRLGEKDLNRLLEVKRCDTKAHAQNTVAKREKELDDFRNFLKQAIESEMCLSLADLAINGNDIIMLGCEKGPKVGKILKRLLNEVLNGSLKNTKQALIERAKVFVNNGGIANL